MKKPSLLESGILSSSSQKQVCINPPLLPPDGSLTNCCSHTLGQWKDGEKVEIHSGLIPPVQRSRQKCRAQAWLFSRPHAPLDEQPWISPSRVSAAPQQCCPSLEVCSLVFSAEPSVPILAWSLHCGGQLLWMALMGLKRWSPGLGDWVLSTGSCPAPLHWISKKCQAALETFSVLHPVCIFHFLQPFWSFPQDFGKVRFPYLCPAHSLDT